MGYFVVRYDPRVVIYKHKMLIRLATGKLENSSVFEESRTTL